ncbi:MAG: hypothetical protein ACE5FZ_06230 [Nitrospiria bacterium]
MILSLIGQGSQAGGGGSEPEIHLMDIGKVLVANFFEKIFAMIY